MKKKKYIDAKKLKVEIRRRWRKYKKQYDKTCSMYYDGALDALDLFEQFIDSLQQEQPEVDLEQEYKKWWDSIKYKINTEHVMEWYMHETARRFYALGLNTEKEE